MTSLRFAQFSFKRGEKKQKMRPLIECCMNIHQTWLKQRKHSVKFGYQTNCQA